MPTSSCGLRLDYEAVRVRVGLRLGLTLCVTLCQCGSLIGAQGLHGFVSLSARKLEVDQSSTTRPEWLGRPGHDLCWHTSHQRTTWILYSSQSPSSRCDQLMHLVARSWKICVASFLPSLAIIDRPTSFLFQRISVLIQRFNAILLHDKTQFCEGGGVLTIPAWRFPFFFDLRSIIFSSLRTEYGGKK